MELIAQDANRFVDTWLPALLAVTVVLVGGVVTYFVNERMRRANRDDGIRLQNQDRLREALVDALAAYDNYGHILRVQIAADYQKLREDAVCEPVEEARTRFDIACTRVRLLLSPERDASEFETIYWAITNTMLYDVPTLARDAESPDDAYSLWAVLSHEMGVLSEQFVAFARKSIL